MDPVTLKLKFQQSACGSIELPLDGRACLELTIGQLKKEQFSAQERSNVTLVHKGVKLTDTERIVDLLTPSQQLGRDSISPSSPIRQVITIYVHEGAYEPQGADNRGNYRTFDPLQTIETTQPDESSSFNEQELSSPIRSRPLQKHEVNIEDLVENEPQNPLDVTPRGKKVQAEGLELLQQLQDTLTKKRNNSPVSPDIVRTNSGGGSTFSDQVTKFSLQPNQCESPIPAKKQMQRRGTHQRLPSQSICVVTNETIEEDEDEEDDVSIDKTIRCSTQSENSQRDDKKPVSPLRTKSPPNPQNQNMSHSDQRKSSEFAKNEHQKRGSAESSSENGSKVQYLFKLSILEISSISFLQPD